MKKFGLLVAASCLCFTASNAFAYCDYFGAAKKSLNKLAKSAGAKEFMLTPGGITPGGEGVSILWSMQHSANKLDVMGRLTVNPNTCVVEYVEQGPGLSQPVL